MRKRLITTVATVEVTSEALVSEENGGWRATLVVLKPFCDLG
jgi:hypothetical protein